MELVKLRQSTQELYNDIDSCITDLINARTPEKKDEDGERKALFRMEGLMVATLQQLSCIEDYLGEWQEVDLEKFTEKMDAWKTRYNYPDNIPIKAAMAFTARMFYMYPKVARAWYDSLPKVTLD